MIYKMLFPALMILIACTLIFSNSASAATITVMNDTHNTLGMSIYTVQQIGAEQANSTSFLKDKYVDSILIQLKKTGAPAGTASIGIFTTDNLIKKAVWNY